MKLFANLFCIILLQSVIYSFESNSNLFPTRIKRTATRRRLLDKKLLVAGAGAVGLYLGNKFIGGNKPELLLELSRSNQEFLNQVNDKVNESGKRMNNILSMEQQTNMCTTTFSNLQSDMLGLVDGIQAVINRASQKQNLRVRSVFPQV